MIPVGKVVCVTLGGNIVWACATRDEKSGFKGGMSTIRKCKRWITPKPKNVNLIITNAAVPMRMTFLLAWVNWRVNFVQLLGHGLSLMRPNTADGNSFYNGDKANIIILSS